MQELPKQTWGEAGDRPPLYFAHANAYPPGSYSPIISALAEQQQVISYLQRPLWQPAPDPSSLHNWQQLADDVVRFFDQNQMKNVVAVGHSLGSVTAFMAARKRPDLIKALVMIEPVALPGLFCWMTRLLPSLVKSRVNIIDKALNRPHQFDSLQSAFDFHRKTRAFKRLSDDNLWHYIRAAFRSCEQGFCLAYPREWEARVYGTATAYRHHLLRSQLPVLALRGGHTTTIDEKFWRRWRQNPNHQLVDFPDAGHLLPLEDPQGVLAEVLPYVEQHQR